MQAVDVPIVQQQQKEEPQSDVIEVIGQRGDQALKIDRRSYRVQQNPHTAQKDVYQLLRGVPAVVISPDDQITLLGEPYVRVLIDGQESRTNLHTLHGSEIERIEIITNPSAQYSASGTGGIINIVIRKQGEGRSGNASIEASAVGRVNGAVAIKSKTGRLTYEIGADGSAGRSRYSTYDKLRTVRQALGGAAITNSERGGGPENTTRGVLRGKLTYDLDPKTSISAETSVERNHRKNLNNADYLGLTPGFQSFSQRQTQVDDFTAFTGLLLFNHQGKTPGESLTASIWASDLPQHSNETNATFTNQLSLRSGTREISLIVNRKLDWQHPIGKDQILSAGAQWDAEDEHLRYRFRDGAQFAADDYRGSQDTLAAYGTFQQRFGSLTMMPGIRVERNSRHIFGSGSDVRISRTRVFPSLHLEHPLGPNANMTLSYSKRIDRAPTAFLRPYPIVLDVLSISQGNPELRDQSVDAYEFNLQYHRKAVSAGLIIYNRLTKNVWTSSYFSNALGQSVFTYVNAGSRRDSGMEIDFTLPIAERLKVMGSANLFSSRVPIDATGARDNEFRYTANSTLEWTGVHREGVPGDVAQLQWSYSSPTTLFQFENYRWHRISLSYTHNLTKDLSLTGVVDSGYLGNGHRVTAPLFLENYKVRDHPEIRIKLLKIFGNR